MNQEHRKGKLTKKSKACGGEPAVPVVDSGGTHDGFRNFRRRFWVQIYFFRSSFSLLIFVIGNLIVFFLKLFFFFLELTDSSMKCIYFFHRDWPWFGCYWCDRVEKWELHPSNSFLHPLGVRYQNLISWPFQMTSC